MNSVPRFSKTKIVCTIGPSSESKPVIEAMIQNGMRVARLNFSHGTHEEHLAKIEMVREASMRLNQPVAILQDLCGPKIRVGDVAGSGVKLVSGQSFVLTTRQYPGDQNCVSVNYKHLPRDVKPGDTIMLADGLLELAVESIESEDITCRVVIGGLLTSHKGVNLPTGSINMPALTEKDKIDLQFGLTHQMDFVALSFVRSAADIQAVKNLIHQTGRHVPVIAKIEKHEAIGCLDEIIAVADGIMVARGDLGVEIPPENVPAIQKQTVAKANEAGKPVIIATQMLRSMVQSPRPTRAEAADVANAVLDGADAIMLSEETASGDYPVEAVTFMARIAAKAEEDYPHKRHLKVPISPEVDRAVAYAACILAENLDAAAVLAPTKSGFTAMQIARFRPRQQIVAVTPDRRVACRLALYWGCRTIFDAKAQDLPQLLEQAKTAALDSGICMPGQLIVITAGHPVWVSGNTNMLRVERL